jgi:hypothetical protein
MALGAFCLRFCAETLNLFEAVAARVAAIFIKWQTSSSGKNLPVVILAFSEDFVARLRIPEISEKISCTLTSLVCYRL